MPVAAAPIPVLPAGDWAYDPRADVWRPLALIEAGTEIEDLTTDQLGDMLDTGAVLPPWFAPETVAAELRHARPPRSERGFVLFLTGLSGSGKSTIARDLRDLLAERGDRRVSLLDGDLVRSLLSPARRSRAPTAISTSPGSAMSPPRSPSTAASRSARRSLRSRRPGSRSGRWSRTSVTSC